jgi:hypothetical protein
MCTQYLYHILPSISFPTSYPLPLVPTSRQELYCPLDLWFCKMTLIIKKNQTKGNSKTNKQTNKQKRTTTCSNPRGKKNHHYIRECSSVWQKCQAFKHIRRQEEKIREFINEVGKGLIIIIQGHRQESGL